MNAAHPGELYPALPQGSPDYIDSITSAAYASDVQEGFLDCVGLSPSDDADLMSILDLASDSSVDQEQSCQSSHSLNLRHSVEGTITRIDEMATEKARARYASSASLAKRERFKRLPLGITKCDLFIGDPSDALSLSISQDFWYDSSALCAHLSKDEKTVIFEGNFSVRRYKERPPRRVSGRCSYYHTDEGARRPKCEKAVQFVVYTMTGGGSDRWLVLVEGACEEHRLPGTSRGVPVSKACSSNGSEYSHRSHKSVTGHNLEDGTSALGAKRLFQSSSPPQLSRVLHTDIPTSPLVSDNRTPESSVNGVNNEVFAHGNSGATGSPNTQSRNQITRPRYADTRRLDIRLRTRYQLLSMGTSPSPASEIPFSHLVAIDSYPFVFASIDDDNFRYDHSATRPQCTEPTTDHSSVTVFHPVPRSYCSYYPITGSNRFQKGRCRRRAQCLVFSFTGPPEDRTLLLVEASCLEHQENPQSGRGLPVIPDSQSVTYEHYQDF